MEISAFLSPSSIAEATEMLKEHNNTKLLAGGTDLVLELRRDMLKPEYLISLNNIAELKNISEDKKNIYIGSMVTFSMLLDNKLIKDNINSFIQCCNNMGSPQIRNMATIGGNIANGGSAADIVPCIISLDGILEITSPYTKRRICCEEYFRNYATERIKENEILTSIIIPKTKGKSGYYKLGKRNSLAIARLSGAVCIALQNDVVTNVNLSLGAVSRFPFKVEGMKELTQGRNIKELFEQDILDYLEKTVEESIKGRKTMPFKKEAVKGVYKEALKSALVGIKE